MIHLDPKHVPVRPGEIAVVPGGALVRARPRSLDEAMMWERAPWTIPEPLWRRLDVAPRLHRAIWLYNGANASADLNAPRIGWHESGALLLTMRVQADLKLGRGWPFRQVEWHTVRVISHDVEEIVASVPEEHFEAALEALTGVRRWRRSRACRA